jgi:hypothetical protein
VIVQVTESNINGSSVIINRYSRLEPAKQACEDWKTAMESYIQTMLKDNMRIVAFSDYWNAPVIKLECGYRWNDCFCVWEELK